MRQVVPVGTFLFIFGVTLGANAELAPATSATDAPAVPAASTSLLKDDPLIQSLRKTEFRASRANDKKRCPGGKFLIGADNTVLIYTRKNDEGIFFGAGEIVSLSEARDEKFTYLTRLSGGGTVRCTTTTNRSLIQEEGLVVVTEDVVEVCGDVAVRKKNVFSVLKDEKGRTRVSLEMNDGHQPGYKCEYFEGAGPERPQPVRPLPSLKRSESGDRSSRRIDHATL